MNILVSELLLPREAKLPTARPHPDLQHLARLEAVYADRKWVFPPIEVLAILAPKDDDVSPLAKAYRDKLPKRWLVTGGEHRTILARSLGLKHIEAKKVTVKEGPGGVDAFTIQVEDNLGHGLQYDPRARDHIMDVYRGEYKITLAEIGKRLHLSKSSVSRILRGKQGGGGGKKTSTKKREAKEWTPEELLGDFIALGSELHKSRKEVLAYLEEHSTKKIINALRSLQATVTALADVKRTDASEPEPENGG